MKIAIHDGKGWNKEWIKYSKQNNIPYVIVNCYDTDIITVLRESKVTHLMWHFNHNIPKDLFMARNVFFSAINMGIEVFPNFSGSWHFDDKVSQKYLLESVKAPLVSSYAFYEKKDAISWAENQTYPIVAKLRRGAGSYNVKMIKSFAEARSYINKMFGKGIHPSPGYIADTKTKLKVAGGIDGIIKRLKKAPNFFKMVSRGRKGFPREKGYVYFQEFIPNNTEDLRIGIVGDKLWAVKRKVRENDFRASGSGMPFYDYSDISEDLINKMFLIHKSIGSVSMSYDLVKDFEGNFLIVEISYGFLSSLFYDAPGYWKKGVGFIEGSYRVDKAIFEYFIDDAKF